MSARRWSISVLLALVATLLAGYAFIERGYGGPPLAFTLVAALSLFLPYFVFAVTSMESRLTPWLDRGRLRLGLSSALLLVPYLVYGGGTGAFSWESFVVLAAFVSAPTMLVLLSLRQETRFAWTDLAAVLLIWLPFDFRWLSGTWPWPEGVGAYGFSTLVAVDLAILLFIGARGWHEVGYRVRPRGRDLWFVLSNFVPFVVLAIPIGTAIGFIRFDPEAGLSWEVLSSFLTIFLFIALPEEFLFRGLIQRFLEKKMGDERSALVVASLVFGAAHLNNQPAPNWSYFLLATLAGLFYGRAYLQSGTLLAPALVHTLVDTVWRAYFR